ncbi:hypothetical protein IMCC21906_02659 [Spongiibacter sp. IMCC21906]|uniref:hypothetical protein n=1 Tax=Spongiibacter sp. IMCC21906 TaxID=1620392 RepID=UPI00062DD3CF|nr:hypothetical protein [Spongiibacter sp. IMCC21906]AKH70304.1 hypothetical protein IMCC21906_02659 [Spongiibacter sp. IMCC21906]
MNRFQKIHGSHSPGHQQTLRAEISRQIDEFLERGGRIEQLAGPSFQPHREVRINAAMKDSI